MILARIGELSPCWRSRSKALAKRFSWLLLLVPLVPYKVRAEGPVEYLCRTTSHVGISEESGVTEYYPLRFRITVTGGGSHGRKMIWVQPNDNLLMSEMIYEAEDISELMWSRVAGDTIQSFTLKRFPEEQVSNNSPWQSGGAVFDGKDLKMVLISEVFGVSVTVFAGCHVSKMAEGG